ncbi:hypothetical protein MP228_002799 [Amoeboaphelidium protococcarum]|nr:hypothetical protein MP228_012529 [Amoeboaphelidium protococcarum]KAI3650147.1 hypothetical protein MP228_004996 [Amoeboaphelidium protococcarum]KAI3652474.1 hypothetical protein MP228_002799 [Amoeboaphelidium protococcarum]
MSLESNTQSSEPDGNDLVSDTEYYEVDDNSYSSDINKIVENVTLRVQEHDINKHVLEDNNDNVNYKAEWGFTIAIHGYKFYNNQSKYRCANYRKPYYCKSTFDPVLMAYTEHQCARPVLISGSFRNVSDEMEAIIADRAVKNIEISPTVLYDQAFDYVTEKYQDYHLMPYDRQKAINKINNLRRNLYKEGSLSYIEQKPLSEFNGQNFFQVKANFQGSKKLETIIIWGLKEQICHLKRNGSVFIDGTFHCVPIPKQFHQLITVMLYDASWDIYYPVAWILTSGKAEEVYRVSLQHLKMIAGSQWQPRHVTCDFEKSLINAVKNEFRGAEVIGCLFHFKQALRRKLKELKFVDADVHFLMQVGMLDLLCLIPEDEVEIYGIPYIQGRCNGVSATEQQLADFWKYFVKTWLELFSISDWNVSRLEGQQLVNRTNNPLESYNRLLNQDFKNHPTMVAFIAQLKRHADKYIKLQSVISQGGGHGPKHTAPQEVSIQLPQEYLAFKSKSQKAKKQKNNRRKAK